MTILKSEVLNGFIMVQIYKKEQQFLTFFVEWKLYLCLIHSFVLVDEVISVENTKMSIYNMYGFRVESTVYY